MTMRRFLALVSAAALAIPLLTTTAAAAGPGSSAAAAARARHEATVRHWTAERMRAATPRDFTFDAVRGFQPAAKPGGGGGAPGTTTGASWPNGLGTVYTAVGKVYFQMGGSGYVCSGVTVADGRSGHSLVQTAGHCAYDESAGAFATNWMFIPQYDTSPTLTCPQTTYGCWTADSIFVHRGYATAGSFNTQATLHDWAYVVVGPGGHGGAASLEALGTFGFSSASFAEGTSMRAMGYPAAGRYKGRDLIYCQGGIFFDPYNGDDTYGMPCNMTGGSSGGPWFTGFDVTGNTGTLSSLNSYGYSGITAMHGPKFNANTQATFNAASSSGSLAGVGQIIG